MLRVSGLVHRNGVIDASGREVIPAGQTLHGIGAFLDGHAISGNEEGIGVIDLAGNFVVPPGTFFTYIATTQGMLLVKGPTGGVAFVDLAGQFPTAYWVAGNPFRLDVDGFDLSPLITAYNIEGNNYFKLRDIAQLFNFKVALSAEWPGVIDITTTADYSPQ